MEYENAIVAAVMPSAAVQAKDKIGPFVIKSKTGKERPGAHSLWLSQHKLSHFFQ